MGRWKPAPVIGGAYSDDAKPWTSQDTVNYIPVMAERPGGRSPTMLRGVPGMVTFCNLGTGKPIRGARNVEGALLVVSGTGLYKIATDGAATLIGTIPGVGRVSMSHNQITGGNEVAIANGQSGYVYNTVTGTLAQITDEGFPGAISFDFIDGYITGIEPARRFAFHSNLAAATDYNTLDRYEAEGSPDKLVGQIVDHREWWLFSERTIEPFVNTGATTNTFQRASNTMIEVGCASGASIAQMDSSVFWVGNDGIVYRANGYTPQRISTHAIEQALAKCNLSQCFAFTFEDQGHKVYYITCPDGQTWGYDASSGEWHRRQSEGLNRWRINTLTKWSGYWIAGDYTNGKLYVLDWKIQHEDGAVLERRRITGVLHDNQNRVTVDGVALVFDTGLPGDVYSPLVPPLKITGSLPQGRVGDIGTVSYQYTTSGGVLPRIVSLLSGALPTGLSVNSSGLVTGSFTAPGVFSWTLQVSDADGSTAQVSQTMAVIAITALDPATLFVAGTGGSISADNLTLTKTADASGFNCAARAPVSSAHTSGKFYIEFTTLVATNPVDNNVFGLYGKNQLPAQANLYTSKSAFCLFASGPGYVNAVFFGSGGPNFTAAGKTVGLAVDCATGNVWWRGATGWNPGGDPVSGANPFKVINGTYLGGGLIPFASTYSNNGSCRVNFGQEPFKLGAVPDGFFGGWQA